LLQLAEVDENEASSATAVNLIAESQRLCSDDGNEISKGFIELVIHHQEIGFGVVAEFIARLCHAALDHCLIILPACVETMQQGF
jgi:hypothetical protein